MATSTSLPYKEPDIITILTLSSFLLLANVLNSIVDKLLYCGIIGQVLLGVAWGTPGAKWLSTAVEETIVQLGYIGLILLVYEGGLSTYFAALKANLFLSSCVALTGICLPIALSFALTSLANASFLQSFAAGAALCSTSLGTTFTVLSATGLARTRLGVVLSSAAMMDDVVGLVMVQVVSNLGGAQESISATVIVRSILVSLAFAICVPLACLLVAKPVTETLNGMREAKPERRINKALSRDETALVIHTLLLVALVTAASYAGTSNLFAAYLAGAIVSWWDNEVVHVDSSPSQDEATSQAPPNEQSIATADLQQVLVSRPFSNRTSGVAVFEDYYKKTLERILKPFFFASIGFSIPISKMFSGTIVWKGLIYALLMMFGKLICGIWLVRIPMSGRPSLKTLSWLLKPKCHRLFKSSWGAKHAETRQQSRTRTEKEASAIKPTKEQKKNKPLNSNATASHGNDETSTAQTPQQTQYQWTILSPGKPLSLYSPAIVAFAMVARGEIGFLISAVAQSSGIFQADQVDSEFEIFLVVAWAILLCTIVGPLCVGILVRRVKKLEARRASTEGRRDVLGVWGVQ